MSKPEDGGPAFPRPISSDGVNQPDYGHPGMTLRDWFAGMAMQGLLGGPTQWPEPQEAHNIAKIAAKVSYLVADEMLKGLETIESPY